MRMLVVLPTCCLLSAGALAQTNSEIAIERVWAPPTPCGAAGAAVYMTITNRSDADDRLVSATSPAARAVQVHWMRLMSRGIEMRAVAGGLPAPARRSLTLAPDGWRLALIGLARPLKPGDTIHMTLHFQRNGSFQIDVPVLLGGAEPVSGAPGGKAK